MSDDFNPFGPIDLKRWPRALFRLDSLDTETLVKLKEDPTPEPAHYSYSITSEHDPYSNVPKLEVKRIGLSGVRFKVEPEHSDLAANDCKK